MTFMMFLKQSAKGQNANAKTTSSMSLDNVDFKTLYAMKPQLEHMPRAAFIQAQQIAIKQDSSTLSQTGVTLTRVFYKQLGIDTAKIQSLYILKAGTIMLLLSLFGVLAMIGAGYLAAKISAGASKKIRHDIFSKVESFSAAEFDNFSTASLITRTTNDITQVQNFIMMGLRMLCFAPILGIGGVVMALRKSLSLSWTIALAIVVLIGIILVVYVLVMPKFKIMQKLVDRLNLVTRDNLSGMMVIRAFGTEKFEKKRFDVANNDLTNNQMYVNRTIAIMFPFMMFMLNVLTLIIVWVGAHQIAAATIQVGDMMAFMQYAMIILMGFLMVSVIFIIAPRAFVSGQRIIEVMDTEITVKNKETVTTFGKNVLGRVEFKNVGFKYKNAESNVIEDISFTAAPGQTTAFIGSTGSGKSTLINLIPRFYDVTEGSILIDGVDIRDVAKENLREHIGFVPQKGVLFSGDIAGNLRYGKHDATDEEILESAKVAQAEEFIASSEDGMEMSIAQGGSNVSGGQKQRLAIARALIKKAPIYIFDDSFSALDFTTDAALRRALKTHVAKATVLIVAQRISTIMNAEQIIVLDEGKIVGKGTHRELLKSCTTYREIAQSQLSEEELR